MQPGKRLAAYAAKYPPAVQGSNGNGHTVFLIMRAIEFGVDESEALPVLLQWNASCSPPWKEREFIQKVRGCYRAKGAKFGALADGGRASTFVEPDPVYPGTQAVRDQLYGDGSSSIRSTTGAQWLASRRIDPDAVARLHLARFRPGRWPVLLPTFDHAATAQSWRARAVDPAVEVKELSPKGFTSAGLCFMNAQARRLQPGQRGLIIVEGSTDFLHVATRYEGPVIGIFSGSWNAKHAKRIPKAWPIRVWVDDDGDAGDRYFRQIADTFKERSITRWRTKKT